jgi:hypothetical protein
MNPLLVAGIGLAVLAALLAAKAMTKPRRRPVVVVRNVRAWNP